MLQSPTKLTKNSTKIIEVIHGHAKGGGRSHRRPSPKYAAESVRCVFNVKSTSSPAVAERPRDASSLPVASIVQNVEHSLLLLVT